MITAADLSWPYYHFSTLADAEDHLAALKVSLAMAEAEGFKCGPLIDDIAELEQLIFDCSTDPNF
jgi:hypothetical protein